MTHQHLRTGKETLYDDGQVRGESLNERIAQYRSSGRVMVEADELSREKSWLAVLNGQGVSAEDHNPIADTLDPEVNRAQLRQVADVIARAVPTLPQQDAAIARIIGSSEYEASQAVA